MNDILCLAVWDRVLVDIRRDRRELQKSSRRSVDEQHNVSEHKQDRIQSLQERHAAPQYVDIDK